MNGEAIQPPPYLRLLLLAALLGLISAVIAFIFVVLVKAGQGLLWEQAALALCPPEPIFSASFVAVLVQRETAPVSTIAVIAGLLATARLSITPARPESG